jgi:hypothetical protein
MKPPPIQPITRGLRELTLFFPPDRVAIYRLSQEGLRLVRVLSGMVRQPQSMKRTILAERLRLAQTRLADRYREQRATLLPDEDRAYLSMFGKMEVLIGFLDMPACEAVKLPVTGNGSMAAAERMTRAILADLAAIR